MLCFWRHTCRRNREPLREIIHTSYLIKIKETGVKTLGFIVQGFRFNRLEAFLHSGAEYTSVHVSRNVILLMTVVNFDTKTEKHGKSGIS